MNDQNTNPDDLCGQLIKAQEAYDSACFEARRADEKRSYAERDLDALMAKPASDYGIDDEFRIVSCGGKSYCLRPKDGKMTRAQLIEVRVIK